MSSVLRGLAITVGFLIVLWFVTRGTPMDQQFQTWLSTTGASFGNLVAAFGNLAAATSEYLARTKAG